MAYEIRVHQHGSPYEAAQIFDGPKDAARAKARRLAAEIYPGCTVTWSGSGKMAILVKRDGQPIATVAIEPHTEASQ